MHTVKHDIQRNRLYITLSGVIALAEAAKVREKIIESVNSLLPEFDVVTDLSKYIQGDETAAPILQDVTKFFIEKKVNKIVRIVGQSKTGLMQFAKYSQLVETVNIKYVPTLEEAEQFLSTPSAEDSDGQQPE